MKKSSTTLLLISLMCSLSATHLYSADTSSDPFDQDEWILLDFTRSKDAHDESKQSTAKTAALQSAWNKPSTQRSLSPITSSTITLSSSTTLPDEPFETIEPSHSVEQLVAQFLGTKNMPLVGEEHYAQFTRDTISRLATMNLANRTKHSHENQQQLKQCIIKLTPWIRARKILIGDDTRMTLEALIDENISTDQKDKFKKMFALPTQATSSIANARTTSNTCAGSTDKPHPPTNRPATVHVK